LLPLCSLHGRYDLESAASGKQIGSTWIIREYVTLDERASPEQLASVYEFHLNYLTLGDHSKAAIDYHFKTGHTETA
jgi:hypothetical protein